MLIRQTAKPRGEFARAFDHVILARCLTCVESLKITASTTDGQVFSSLVCLAIASEPSKTSPSWADEPVLVTPEAQERVRPSEIWHHLGGWSDEGDSYDTQEHQFEEDLDRFWADLIGPDEQLRQSLVSPVQSMKSGWTSVTIPPGGAVSFRYEDGTHRTIEPPKAAAIAPAG